jgi:hypothetical protein
MISPVQRFYSDEYGDKYGDKEEKRLTQIAAQEVKPF